MCEASHRVHPSRQSAELLTLSVQPLSNEEEYSKFSATSDRSHVTVRPIPGLWCVRNVMPCGTRTRHAAALAVQILSRSWPESIFWWSPFCTCLDLGAHFKWPASRCHSQMFSNLCSVCCWSFAHPPLCLTPSRLQWPKQLNKGLEEVDPELYDIIEHEKNRQYKVRPPRQPYCSSLHSGRHHLGSVLQRSGMLCCPWITRSCSCKLGAQ